MKLNRLMNHTQSERRGDASRPGGSQPWNTGPAGGISSEADADRDQTAPAAAPPATARADRRATRPPRARRAGQHDQQPRRRRARPRPATSQATQRPRRPPRSRRRAASAPRATIARSARSSTAARRNSGISARVPTRRRAAAASGRSPIAASKRRQSGHRAGSGLSSRREALRRRPARSRRIAQRTAAPLGPVVPLSTICWVLLQLAGAEIDAFAEAHLGAGRAQPPDRAARQAQQRAAAVLRSATPRPPDAGESAPRTRAPARPVSLSSPRRSSPSATRYSSRE